MKNLRGSPEVTTTPRVCCEDRVRRRTWKECQENPTDQGSARADRGQSRAAHRPHRPPLAPRRSLRGAGGDKGNRHLAPTCKPSLSLPPVLLPTPPQHYPTDTAVPAQFPTFPFEDAVAGWTRRWIPGCPRDSPSSSQPWEHHSPSCSFLPFTQPACSEQERQAVNAG